MSYRDVIRPFVLVSTHEDEDDDDDLDRISAVKIGTFLRRRGKYLLFSTHFKNEQIPLVWHRLNEVRRKAALHHFLDSPDWLDFTGRQEYVDLTRTSH
jgi:hypothetical protein